MRTQLLCGGAALLVAATGCGASSSGAVPSAADGTPAPLTAVPGLQAHPAPSGFPAGEYTRTVTLQGEMDGRWRLTLRPDGRYLFQAPQNGSLEGTFDVTGPRIVLHEDCGDGAYTFATTAAGLAFTEVDTAPCQEDWHVLLAGHEWAKAG
jgi:hypothetical protein